MSTHTTYTTPIQHAFGRYFCVFDKFPNRNKILQKSFLSDLYNFSTNICRFELDV